MMHTDGKKIKSRGDMQDEEPGKPKKISTARIPTCPEGDLRGGNTRSWLFRILIIWWVCGNGAQASRKNLHHGYVGGVKNNRANHDGLERQLLQAAPSENINDAGSVTTRNLCVIAFAGLVFLTFIACVVKRNWERCFPPSLPPEPWLRIEDPTRWSPGSEGKGSERSRKMRSPFDECGSRPTPMSTIFPIVSRSLRAIRACTSRKVIDSGRFGCVEKGQFVDAAGKKHDVAVKIAKIPVGHDADIVLDTFKAEIECFERMPLHPNVVRCFGGRLGGPTDPGSGMDDIFIVEELMDMNLRHIITGEKTPWETWTYKTVLQIFRDITAGLEHLHVHNVSHYDLKPENVLVKIVNEVFPLQIKLADFGCSQIKQKTYATAKYAGTKQYMAPEIAWSPYFSLVASGKADIFSLGILMWEILTGEDLASRDIPSADEVRPCSIQAILDCPCEQRWPIADHHPAELSKLIWSCVEFDSSNRPTTKMVSEVIERMMRSKWIADEVAREGVLPRINT